MRTLITFAVVLNVSCITILLFLHSLQVVLYEAVIYILQKMGLRKETKCAYNVTLM